MKILAIRGKNLASLEGEFEIDFKKEPLYSAGIFAIAGSTGSGKSTILDAMCIALYSRTPRLENIKNSNAIEVNGSNSVSEDSIKTILRRGKHEGYAEAEFKAVDGEEYRIRWSIARTNNSPAGNFKKASYDLTNLTTGERKQLSVREHKELMPRLIGLTFEQFTRAVLLAQGNFAAFLKADENEKALILQTLTGTEIYSRISEIIYRRNEEAKKELALIEEKKRGLVILSDEEIVSLNENRNALLKREEDVKKELQIINAKKSWLERLAQLVYMLEKSDNELTTAKRSLEEATPRIEWLKKIDSIQDIRDTYISLCNSEQYCINATKDISEIKAACEAKKAELTKAEESSANATEHQEKINREWLDVQPRIMHAIKLEEQKENETKKEKEIASEKEHSQKEYNENVAKAESIRMRIATLRNEQKNISEWYEKNRCYEGVIPYIPSITVNIATAKNDTVLADNKTKQLATAVKLLDANTKSLEAAKKRKEELELTLSSEIASLRERLVEGMPCPVCGSCHHEVSTTNLNILEEKELEKEKKEVKERLEYLEKAIEGGKAEIAGLQSAIELHRSSAEAVMAKCIEFMQGIENPKELLAKENISATLTDIKTKWENNKEYESKLAEELAVKTNTLELVEKQNGELTKEIASKDKQLKEIQERIEGIKADIEKHLGKGTSAKALQEYYNNRIAEANKAVTDAMKNKMNISEICNRLTGQLGEKSKSLEEEKVRYEKLLKDIENYLAGRNDNLTYQQLKEILSINQATVNALRNEIEKLRNAVATAVATKAERERNIVEHNKADVKPGENENQETLQSAIEEFDKENKELIEQLAAISASLLKNEDNSRMFAQYKEDYEKKQMYAKEIGILNSTFGSASGEKLMKLAQGYTLDILLNVANVHLKEITGRYEMARISDKSLGIKIIDLDMLSESRSVHSLSGGETFLVSFALSLALSSISSNRMSIESLFIDEGFGTLDSETLRTVMSALERLQSQGRTIGVISHSSEMLEQIPVKVAVIKQNAGRSRIEIKEA